MKRIVTLGLLLLFTLSFKAEAQFIKKIQKAAERGAQKAIEKKAEEEMEKMIQKQLEKQLEGVFSNDSESNPVSLDMESILAGIGEDVPVADEYHFLGFMVLQLEATEKNGKKDDPVLIKSLIGAESSFTGMEINDPKNPDVTTTMIMDTEHEASVMFMDNKGEKSSFAYKLNMDGIDAMVEENFEESLAEDDITLEKTGNTKSILGYECEEFHVKNEDGEGYYWVTTEPIDGVNSFWSMNSPFVKDKAQQRYREHFKNLPQGNFMEMTYTSTDGSVVDMKVIEIEPNSPKTYTSSEYPNLMAGIETK